MKRLIAALVIAMFASASIAGDHGKPKPQPTPAPTPAPAKDSNDFLPIALLAAALVGVVVYQQKRERDEKRVALQPTPDGKGLQAAVEYRF